jgi:hypothetical protein
MSDRLSDDASPARPVARTRTLALIGVPDERRATHTASFPLDPSRMLPDADVVLLVADDDPGAMLFRYTAYGELAGDTWHPDADAARAQVADEYGDALQPWVDVPEEVTDAHHFAVRYAAERINDREGR